MTPASIAILSFSMSADAFAAAIGRGAVQRPNLVAALKGGLVFGVIEAITPLIGWGLGLAAAGFVGAVDHWIAFGLLAIVGGRMIWEAVSRDEAEEEAPAIRGRAGAIALVATAIGTSIDAAAVGVGLALLESDIMVIALAIGAATFTMSSLGLLIGRAVGARLGRIVEVLGGIGLIALGTLILCEHLGLLVGWG